MKKPTETLAPYPSREAKELFSAILKLKTPEEAANFFRDLLTIAEIKEFANRWQMVKMLVEGNPYIKIAQKLNVSTTTVTRVAQWLYDGMGGYQLIANRSAFKKHKNAAPKPFRLRGKYTLLKNPYSM